MERGLASAPSLSPFPLASSRSLSWEMPLLLSLFELVAVVQPLQVCGGHSNGVALMVLERKALPPPPWGRPPHS